MEQIAGPNLYGYVSAQPLTLVDPLGLCEIAVWRGGYIVGWKPCNDERPQPGDRGEQPPRPQPRWPGHVELPTHIPKDTICYPESAPDSWTPLDSRCYMSCVLSGLGSALAFDISLHGAGEGISHNLASDAAKKFVGRSIGGYSAYSIGKRAWDAKSVCNKACRGF